MIDRRKVLIKVRGWVLQGKKVGKGEPLPCNALVLRHVSSEGRPKLVDSWEVEEATDVEQLVSAVIDAAEEDASNAGDTNQYVLEAYFGDAASTAVSAGNYGAMMRLRINAPPNFEESDDGSGSSEMVTTPKAFAAMVGRFANDFAKINIPWNNEMMRMQQRIIQQQNETIEKMSRERERMVILQEKLLNQNHRRALQLRKVMFWERQKEEIAGILFPMLPTVISAIAGKQLGPAKTSVEGVSFEQFFKRLAAQPEKLGRLQPLLKMPQMMAVGQMSQAIAAGQPVDPIVLREFVKTIDDQQMEAFKEILDGEELQMLLGVVRSFYEQYEAERKKAQEEYQRHVSEDPTAGVEEEEVISEQDIFS